MKIEQIRKQLENTKYTVEEKEDKYIFTFDGKKSFECSKKIKKILLTGNKDAFSQEGLSIDVIPAFMEFAVSVDWDNGIRIFYEEAEQIIEEVFYPKFTENKFVEKKVGIYSNEEALKKIEITEYALADENKGKLWSLTTGESLDLYGIKFEVINGTSLISAQIKRETRDTALGKEAMKKDCFDKFYPSSISDTISFYIETRDMTVLQSKFHSKLQDRWIFFKQENEEILEKYINRFLSENIDYYLDVLPDYLNELESAKRLIKTSPRDIINCNN